jgi:hypothetical protein
MLGASLSNRTRQEVAVLRRSRAAADIRSADRRVQQVGVRSAAMWRF